MRKTIIARAGVLGVAAAVFCAATAFAQSGTSNAFKGFGNSKDPIQIEADNLGVATPDQIVTITGNVQVQQKDTTLNTQVLKVFYENAQGTQAPADPTSSGTQIRRFEASGHLVITQPNQTVTGDSGWFDMPSQKAEVLGNVVLTQCTNVARGSKLLINLRTGEYKLEGGDKGRVQLSITNNDKSKCK
jgi:lipopolysaccharide export system protein LptA